MAPSQVAQRDSRLGCCPKFIITLFKTSAVPEPQNSRVSRSLEYIFHLPRVRTLKIDEEACRCLPPELGGSTPLFERDQLSYVWEIPTSAGGNGHCAQFSHALPGR